MITGELAGPLRLTAADRRHRITGQVHVVLSPAAHLAATTAWRESLWVDLGIGWCGLSAYLPCENRLACLPCPNFIEKREQLPVLQEQCRNLIELRMLGNEQLPADRKDEITSAVEALDQRMPWRPTCQIIDEAVQIIDERSFQTRSFALSNPSTGVSCEQRY